MIKYILALLTALPTPATAELYETDKQQFVLRNILEAKNPGFENNKAGWTASGGTFAIATSGGNKLTGAASATWDSGSAAQTFTSATITIPNGLVSRSGLARCKIQVPSGTATHTLGVYNGTSLIASETITSSTIPTYTHVPFLFEASASTVALRVTSVASDEPLIAIDDCYLGDNLNLSSISQATFIGSAYIPATASCTAWARTNTALGAFATDADCPGPTVELNPGPGVIQTTDADLPRFTVNNLPSGNYKVVISGIVTGSTSSSYADVSINDGTTSSGRSSARMSAATVFAPFTVVGNFTYTSAASRTFELYDSANTGSVNVENSTGNGQLYFSIYRYPSSSEVAMTTEQSDYGWTSYTPTFTGFGTVTSIEFYHRRVGTTLEIRGRAVAGTTTAVEHRVSLPGSLTSTALTAIQACGSYINGQTSTNSHGGLVLIEPSVSYVTFGFNGTFGSNSGNPITKSATSESVVGNSQIFSMFASVPISGWQTSNRAPQLVNSVINSSSGVTRIEAADLNCDAGSVITRQHGSWVSSIGNISGGLCAVTLSAGVFSSTPYCTATDNTNGGGTGFILRIIGGSSTTTNISVDCDDDASTACTAYDFILTCVGAK